MGYIPPPPPPPHPSSNRPWPSSVEIDFGEKGGSWRLDDAFDAFFDAMSTFGRYLFPKKQKPPMIRDFSDSPSLIGTWKVD